MTLRASIQCYHANFIQVYHAGVCIIGQPKIGKSTLTYTLLQRGHSLIADDVTLFFQRGKAIIGFAPTRLKKRLSINNQTMDVTQTLTQKAYKRYTQLNLICHLVKDNLSLLSSNQAPTIVRHTMLERDVPEILFPAQQPDKLAKKLEKVVQFF